MDFDLTSNLTPAELEALDELKEKLSGKLEQDMRKDDAMFLRFLRARDFDVSKASLMLSNHLDWRKQVQVDTLLQNFEPPEVGKKYLPMSRIGFDKEGYPVRALLFGKMDLRGLLKSVSKSECVKTILHHLETDVAVMKKQSEKYGRLIERWHYIFDFEGYSLSQATHKQSLELLINIFMTYEANYPERLESAYIINASVYFTIVFSVIKPLLSGNTLKKIKVFGKEGWQQELQKFIDPQVLPVFLGGTKTDPNGDPRCPSIVVQGGPVPKHYYFYRTQETRLAYQPGVKKYQVPRMSKIQIILDVDEPGSYIEWEFETESHDIGFGVYYKETEADKDDLKNMKEIIPKQRVGANSFCESGMYQCDQPGMYVLLFDNSYSWIQEKEVFCRAVVVSPERKEICVAD